MVLHECLRPASKFDKLQQTSSGQPIFNVDEEVASRIWATFVLDLSLVRSFSGLSDDQKHVSDCI